MKSRFLFSTPQHSALLYNIGSGVGAGVVVNGKLYHGANDLAGEIGHMTIDFNEEIFDCGNKGCLQTFATGTKSESDIQ